MARKIAAAAAVATMTLLSVVGSGARTPSWDDGADSRKAAYIFMEAQRQQALENLDAYYSLLSRAFELDSTDTSVGFDIGYYKMHLSPDSAGAVNGYGMMTHHFLTHPGDYYNDLTYAIVSEEIGKRQQAIAAWRALDSIKPHTPAIIAQYAKILAYPGDSASIRKSISLVEEIEQLEGVSLQWTALKLNAYYLLADTASIFGEMHRLIDAVPDNPDYYIALGELHQSYGDRDSVEFYFNRACEADSTYGRAIYRRAAYYREKGDSAAFDNEVFRALRLPTLDLDDKLAILHDYVSQLYNDSTRHPQIQSLFDLLIEQHPHEKDLRDLYAGYLIVIDDLPGAIEQKVGELDLDPADEQGWGLVASLYAQLDDFPNAFKYARNGLEYFPDAFGLNRLAGYASWEMKDYEGAKTYVRRAIDHADGAKPNELSTLYNLLGEIYYNLNDVDSVVWSYDQSLKIDPADISTLNNYAYFLTLLGGDLNKAEMMSRECVSVEPDNPVYLDTYAWVLFQKGEYDRAREYIDRAIVGDEKHQMADVYEHAGDIYFMLAEKDRALELWKESLRIEPDNDLLKRKIKDKKYYDK